MLLKHGIVLIIEISTRKHFSVSTRRAKIHSAWLWHGTIHCCFNRVGAETHDDAGTIFGGDVNKFWISLKMS